MTWTYRPALDGVRTLAVYLVLLYHAGLPRVAGGYVGVDLFFVLSGFLVTHVILSEIDERGSLRLGRFYARRVRRLLPAAVVVIVLTAAAAVLTSTVVTRLPYVGDARSALLYVANWHFLAASNDYFALDVDKSPFLHFWSLSIEEQFYLFFPVLLVLAVGLSRRWAGRWAGRWALATVLAGLLACSVVSQLHWMSADPVHAFYGTDARLYQLLAGALLATVMRTVGPFGLPGLVSTAGLLLLLVVASDLISMNTTWRGLVATVAGVLLLLGVTSGDRTPVARLLARPVAVHLGRISYGTYLWHWPVILVLGAVLDVPPVVLAALAAGLATGLAALSYDVLEMPVRRREWPSRAAWPTVASGVVVSLTVALLVVPPLLQSDRKPSLVASRGHASGVTFRDGPVPDIDFRAVQHDVGPQTHCSRAEECYFVRGDGPTVVVVGDSHARMMMPMFEKLAEEKGFTLAANIQTGCPWQAEIVNLVQPPATQQACTEGRAAWYADVLPQLHPDLVVLVGQSYTLDPKFTPATLQRAGGSDETVEELLQNTTTETLDTIAALGSRSLVMLDTLRADENLLSCLAAARLLSECTVSVPLADDPSDAIYVAEDVRRPDVYTFDIDPLLCPDAPVCRPVLRGRVIWHDDTHLTTRIGVFLRERIWERIRLTGVLDDLGL